MSDNPHCVLCQAQVVLHFGCAPQLLQSTHAGVHLGSNAALESASASMSHSATVSALLRNAQDMLVRQQLEEASVRAASFAASSSLQEAQVGSGLPFHARHAPMALGLSAQTTWGATQCLLYVHVCSQTARVKHT